MGLFRERLRDFRQNSPRVNHIELIASYVHPKTGNRGSHLRAIMTLDHRRLIRPGKNQAKFLAFDKFTLQNLANKSGRV